jgi:hypothetical protein
VCSFLLSIFGGRLNRQDVFEFFTKFNSVNWVRLNSSISICAVYLPLERSFLWVCYFFIPKIVSIFENGIDAKQLSQVQAEHENRNRLFQFAEIFLPVPF